MLSADSTTPQAATQALYESDEDEDAAHVSLADILTWLGEKKKLIGAVTLAAAVVSLIYALLITPTHRTGELSAGNLQRAGRRAALAALAAGGSAADREIARHSPRVSKRAICGVPDDRFNPGSTQWHQTKAFVGPCWTCSGPLDKKAV
jgi:hypothetical protein